MSMKIFFSPTDFFHIRYHHYFTQESSIAYPNSRKKCSSTWMKVDPFIHKNWKRLSDPNELGMAGVVFPKPPKGLWRSCITMVISASLAGERAYAFINE